MPLDFGLLDQGPRINTPFENLSQILQVRQQQDSARGLAEQRQAIAEQRRAQTDALQRDAEREARLTALFTNNPKPTRADIMKADPSENGQKIATAIDALQDADLKRYKDQRAVTKEAIAGLNALPETMRPNGYGAIRQTFLARGWATPEDIPEQYDPTFVAGIQKSLLTPEKQYDINNPKPPADYNLGDSRMSGATNQPLATAAPKVPEPPKLGSLEDFIGSYATTRRLKPEQLSAGDKLKAKAQYEAAGRAPTQSAQDNSPLETIIGPDGTPIRVRRQDAIGKAPASGTMKPASGVEKRALNFFNRAAQADTELEQLEPDIQKMGLASQGRLSYAPNMMQSQLGQSYGAAQRAFTEARLRKDSGAAIPEGEFVNDRKTYFAQPGDSQTTLEQKRRARGAILASLAFESGQALGEFVGDADEAKSLVQKYKARSSGTATAKPKVDPLGIR